MSYFSHCQVINVTQQCHTDIITLIDVAVTTRQWRSLSDRGNLEESNQLGPRGPEAWKIAANVGAIMRDMIIIQGKHKKQTKSKSRRACYCLKRSKQTMIAAVYFLQHYSSACADARRTYQSSNAACAALPMMILHILRVTCRHGVTDEQQTRLAFWLPVPVFWTTRGTGTGTGSMK